MIPHLSRGGRVSNCGWFAQEAGAWREIATRWSWGSARGDIGSSKHNGAKASRRRNSMHQTLLGGTQHDQMGGGDVLKGPADLGT